MTASEQAFVIRVQALAQEIMDQEYMKSKNENRLCGMFDNTNARADIRRVFNAIMDLTF